MNEPALLSPPPQQTSKFGARIKAALVQWLGVPIELTNGAFWAEFGRESNAGERVSVTASLRISAVWACVRLLSETISTLPINLYKRVPDRQIATAHPLYGIVHDSPNADMTAVTFWEVMLASMLLWGNCFAEILRAGGRVIALSFIRPELVRVGRATDGSKLYRVTDAFGRVRMIVEQDMFHVPAFSIDGMVGLSPVSYAANVMGNAIAADKASGSVFKRGLMLAGTFETANTVKESLRGAFQERLDAYRGALASGTAPLLEAGISYKPLAINPNDAQLLETRAFSIEEICRWYRVPPFMVGHSEKSTSWGTGIEQQNIGFLTYALRPWLKRVEQAINRKLLTPTERIEYYAEFNIDALLRADSAARAAFYSTMVQNGIFTRNECRVKENLAAMAGGDKLTAQVNLAPLDQLGEAQQQQSNQARQSLAAWLGLDEVHNSRQSTSTAQE